MSTKRRWALSPLDSRSHLATETEDVTVGMVITECGRLLPGSVQVSPHPPTGLWCPTCAQREDQVGVQRPLGDADLITLVSPELMASLVLRLACDDGVTKVGDHYLDRGFPTPDYLAGVFDGLINAGLLTLGEEDPSGMQQVSITEAGHARYAQLRNTHQPAGLQVPKPRFPTTRPTTASHQSTTPQPAAGTAPDPVRGSGPAMHWARCPTDGRLHAIAPTDSAQAVVRGIRRVPVWASVARRRPGHPGRPLRRAVSALRHRRHRRHRRPRTNGHHLVSPRSGDKKGG
jgi:hypothetical protein